MKITKYMGAFAVIAMLAACSTDDEQGTNTAANEVKIKEIQQTYYQKFLKVLPANKVFRIVKAEKKFHRQLMQRHALKYFKKRNDKQ